jgi:hypothetical protein
MQLLIGFVFLGLLLMAGGWLLRPTAPVHLRGERSGGQIVLRPPRGRNAILAAMALGPTLLVVAVALTAARKDGMSTAGVILVAAVVAFGLAVTAHFAVAEARLRVFVDDTRVVRQNPAGRRSLSWGEVDRVYYNGVNRWFVLSGGGTRLWVNENMAGIGDFAEIALARVRPQVLGAEPVALDALKDLVEEARQEDAARR